MYIKDATHPKLNECLIPSLSFEVPIVIVLEIPVLLLFFVLPISFWIFRRLPVVSVDSHELEYVPEPVEVLTFAAVLPDLLLHRLDDFFEQPLMLCLRHPWHCVPRGDDC